MNEYKKNTPVKTEDMIRYLQWKSAAWRNIAVDLANAIKSNNTSDIEKAIKNFEEVRNKFPYEEI